MRKSSGPDRTILYRFSYPVYQLKVIGPNTLLAAGGGGNSKTGVPNRIDLIQFDRPAYAPIRQDSNEALIPANTMVLSTLLASDPPQFVSLNFFISADRWPQH